MRTILSIAIILFLLFLSGCINSEYTIEHYDPSGKIVRKDHVSYRSFIKSMDSFQFVKDDNGDIMVEASNSGSSTLDKLLDKIPGAL